MGKTRVLGVKGGTPHRSRYSLYIYICSALSFSLFFLMDTLLVWLTSPALLNNNKKRKREEAVATTATAPSCPRSRVTA